MGCDARRADGVEKIYALKERDRAKSMLVLVSEACGEALMAAHPALRTQPSPPDRPTTFILPASLWKPVLGDGLASGLAADDGSLGIRVPRHPFCQRVLQELGGPLVSSSANLSGRPSPSTYGEIEEALKRRVDFCVPPWPEFLSGESRGSRILKLETDGTLAVIRP